MVKAALKVIFMLLKVYGLELSAFAHYSSSLVVTCFILCPIKVAIDNQLIMTCCINVTIREISIITL